MKTKFEREEFFNLCWEKSISWFCRNYMVTYSEFKNLCSKHEIPLPPNGYWMKRKYGKETKKPTLPQTEETIKIELFLRTKEILKKSRSIGKQTLVGDEQKKYELEVPKRLPKNPDPIIQEMLSAKPKRHPVVNNIYDYSKRYNYGRISVSATEKVYKRALCFLNTFITVMKSRGHYFLFCYENSYLVIEGIEIEIRMRERSKRVYKTDKWGYRSSKLEPIGLLSLLTGRYSDKKEWQETSTKSLAEKLPVIINYLEEEAKKERKWQVENEKRLKKQAIEKKKQEEKEKLQKEEIEQLRFIKQKSDLWHEAKKLAAFLDACNESKNLTEEMQELVLFGYQKVKWLDPLNPFEDKLFSDIDPYQLLKTLG